MARADPGDHAIRNAARVKTTSSDVGTQVFGSGEGPDGSAPLLAVDKRSLTEMQFP
jgi:hypothetical protein